MLINAVIVAGSDRQIRKMLKTNHFYATATEEDNKSFEIRFYINETEAKRNYPKEIKKVLQIVIDTEKMEFFGENNSPVILKPKFYKTDAEYVFKFDESIKDLHYKFNLL